MIRSEAEEHLPITPHVEMATASEQTTTSHDPTAFAQLMDRLAAGSEEAAFEIVEVYSPHVLRVIRASLPREIRSKVDSVDLLNTLLASLLVKRTRLAGLSEPGQLIALLTKAARNRVIDEHRRYTTCEARSIRSEAGGFEELAAETDHTRSAKAGDGKLGGREQTPSNVAIAREKWDRVLKALNRHERRVVMLRMKGQTYDKISESIADCSPRTARRIIARVTELLLQ